MKTLLRWLGLVLSLIVARVLLALAILAGVIFFIGQGMQALGLQPPTQQEVDARLAAVRTEFAPMLARIRAAVQPSTAANSAPGIASQPAQSQP